MKLLLKIAVFDICRILGTEMIYLLYKKHIKITVECLIIQLIMGFLTQTPSLNLYNSPVELVSFLLSRYCYREVMI